MSRFSDRLTGAATPEELLSCVQLLAISVVQHREKSGFVALRQSSEQLHSPSSQIEETGVFEQSQGVLEEALEMVRALAAKPEPEILFRKI